MTKHIFSFLALGDSYTIGEALPLYESFPYQTVQLLRKANLHFHAPEIVAKTGWTTAELAEHILHTKLNEHYDFVTLLIGVNNQYRELSIDDYATDFEFLLRKAIHFAAEKKENVIVLSIPDWSVTPFAKKSDNKKVAAEIDAYNKINKAIAERNKIKYVDITPNSRTAKNDAALITTDGLHPSGKAYAEWAIMLAAVIQKMVKV
ncbi:SGNH/GDSL hydrolase family protein [Panacibacter ginsenosidivorans]|uniref:SGNH/GDSL hydrolase family protein n=1 Tax=Panacibacter ginsenosidivorans TaxID=1813871 RepID=A0A5B8VBS1_9BACT|nr:SGNH/GDSL hydrolase family protein [Panacibacter ginsenosidivorans]QEC68762.1 SGNH/GDSL hydrolase family protein [Panacibacter ginsenosidivorans]